MIEKVNTRGLLTSEQLINSEDEELFIMKVPASIGVSSLLNIDFNMKSSEDITVKGKVYTPVVQKNVKPKAVIVPTKKGKPGVKSVELKGVISLRESVAEPIVTKIEIPRDSGVAPPPLLVSRHPIYGREAVLKRARDEEIKQEDDQVEVEEPAKKKKKKKKDKKS